MEAITREEKIMSGENLTPITRKEMFLAKASGMDIETPTPITREEIFLSKIGGTGGGTSGATAYTVSSVDELPSNAVDGSMAIVEGSIQSLAGTEWLLDEYIASTGNVYKIESMFSFQYFIEDDTFGDLQLGMSVNDYGDYIDISYLPTAQGLYDDGWTNPYNRYLSIETEPNTKIAEFIITHGTQQGGNITYRKTYYLYIKENGEWVYKCEVV